jgi:hypothetical protein
MYCSSVKLRKKTIKGDKATVLNFIKYFSDVRETMLLHADDFMEKEKEFILSKIA